MCTANKNITSESVNTEKFTGSSKITIEKDSESPVNEKISVSIDANRFVSPSEIIVVDSNESGVVSAFDVARYILKKIKRCSTMKLHKLLYYCQCWNLVWEEKPLFSQSIEAWANGPVVREVFNFHKGKYYISYEDLTIGNETTLSDSQKENIDEVLRFYGDKSAQWLIDQTHCEDPWRQARVGMSSGDSGANEITLDSMHSYYASLHE